ncbi:hypothetical protein Hokovirus_1_253 [Hokovirus HKV1]|uniref:Uncharacterized protein n=1 Tax=Hokovirus HKV1 TaxID=1977638 RepID=A0A1V0SFF4_9VIRU|nr:hypothetical protein Hokovirus_1_253 [Hokovirus HKV1]
MEFKVLTLECKKVGDKLCLYDLKKKEHNFAEISDSYDMLFLVCMDDYKKFINPNYKLVIHEFQIQLYCNTEFTLYKFGMIFTFYPGLSGLSQLVSQSIGSKMFKFYIYYNGARAGYSLGECLDDTLLTQRIDDINKSLPVIVISTDNLMQNTFLRLCFNITKTNIKYAKMTGYLIEKKEFTAMEKILMDFLLKIEKKN